MEGTRSFDIEASLSREPLIENIGQNTRQEYMERACRFHGCVSPGVLIGGIMVGMAQKEFSSQPLCDVICETLSCLPDAVQLLTPCTIGNAWMRIINLGRYAVSLYDKFTGDGVRVYIDPVKLEKWDEIYSWFLKLRPKYDQDNKELQRQILAAGENILSIEKIHVKSGFRTARSKGTIGICSSCGEAYPERDGVICLGCQKAVPFRNLD